MEVWRSPDGSEIAVIAATWELNPRITFESLADEFKRNPVKAWRNYGSVVSLNIEAAIRDIGIITDRINTVRANPWDEARNRFATWFRGKPGVRYFLHFDLSKNRDATGIALAHRERTGVVVLDFLHRVTASLGQDINFAALRENFVYPLTDHGFRLQLITHDQFQSAETQQVLREKGYETDQTSADKTTEPYDTLIELLMNGRLDYYAHPVFLRELEELKLVNGTKYDHPRKTRAGMPGSKDVADAAACAAWNAVQFELEHPAAPVGVVKVFPSGKSGFLPKFEDDRRLY